MSAAHTRPVELRLRYWRCSIALSVVIMVAGCSAQVASSASASIPASTPTPSPTASPTPSPTPIPTPDAGAAYLAAVAPANAALCTANAAAAKAGTNLKALQAALAPLGPSTRAVADALRKIAFPPRAQSIADELIAKDGEYSASIAAFVAATDIPSANDLLDRLETQNADAAGIANRLRGELGLPDVVGDPCKAK